MFRVKFWNKLYKFCYVWQDYFVDIAGYLLDLFDRKHTTALDCMSTFIYLDLSTSNYYMFEFSY